jgi:ubiquitin-conjugating enzyme E2 D/E
MSQNKFLKIRQERRNLESQPIPGVLVTWPGGSLEKLVAEITAPEDSVYHDDVFRVDITMLDYPDKAPRVEMMTPIFHPNIDSQGAVCIAALRSQWSKGRNLRDILLEIVHALSHPNPDDELNRHAAHLMKTNPGEFEDRARDQVMKNCAARGS